MPETRAPGDDLSEEHTPARILVVDDHELGRRLIARVLEREGHEVIAVASLSAAVAAACCHTPALAVLDLHLSDGDGLELVRVLRDDPRTAAAPIVACTAAVEEPERRRALAAGCDAYVAKPIDIQEFAALVSSLLANPRRVPSPAALARR
jgi:CheY-like chemotaxis protein